MECKYVKEKVWLYVEGDLKQKELGAVERHVAFCPDCAGLVEEVRDSQAWLRSSEPASFDEAFLASVRRGARAKIADCQTSRLQCAAMWAQVNFKPLILACPSLLLVCWLGLHWANERDRNARSSGSGTTSDAMARKEDEKTAVATPPGNRDVKERAVGGRTRRVRKRVHQAPPDEVEDEATQAASATQAANHDTYSVPLRIEIQTEDPNVRIIWFAPGDGSAAAEPENDKVQEKP